jgi:hypothetical protein
MLKPHLAGWSDKAFPHHQTSHNLLLVYNNNLTQK